MEEKPPQRAGREAPRSRTPRAAFSTPEQPTPPSKPAERAPRRAAKSAPPTVTFQPPDEGSEPVPQKKPAPRKAPVRRTAPEAEVRPAAESDQARKATPPVQKAAGAAGSSEPTKSEPTKSEPTKAAKTAQPAKAAAAAGPAKAAEAIKAEPAKAAAEPAKAAGAPAKAAAEPAKAAAEPAKAATDPVTAATDPATAAKAAPMKRAARKATRTGAKAIPKATTPAQRKPASAGEETVEVGAELATTEARAVEPKPAAKAARPDAEPRTEAWAKIVADPGHAPELLALAAVQTIGPRAKEWARRTREEYPAATPDALARLAVAQFTRVGSVGSVFAALAGSYAPIALLGVNAYTYAELILHVAAAHGLDPTDPRRAVDLLVLSQVHPDADEAEAALAIARQPAYEEEARFTDAVWRLGRMAATQAAVWMLLKGVNRFFPGAAVLAAVMTSRSGARNMGVRATRFYSRDDQRPA